MKALSIRQPWAWLIVTGRKDIENRTWPTSFRGELLIHAGKTFDYEGHAWVVSEMGLALPDPDRFERGGIVGVAEIIDCVTQYDSPWYFGPYGFIIKNARVLPFLPMPGALGFFAVEVEPENPGWVEEMAQTVTQEVVGTVLRDAAAKARVDVRLSSALRPGNHIRIKSPESHKDHTTDFVQEVTAIYVDGRSVRSASNRTKGTIQIRVTERVHEDDVIYRIFITVEPPPPGSPTGPGGGGGPGTGPGKGDGKKGRPGPKHDRTPHPNESRHEKEPPENDEPSLPDPSESPPPDRGKKKGRGIGG